MAVERRVDGGLVELRRHDLGHEDALRKAWHLVDHVRPRLACVARHLEHPVVAAGVEQTGLPGRLCQRHDRRPGGNPVVARDRDVAALHAHRDDLGSIGVGSEIGADSDPREPSVRRPEDLVGTGVNDLGIVRRMDDRRIPVPAQGWLAGRRLRTNRHRLAGDAIDPDHVAVLRFAVDHARVDGILEHHEPVAALDCRPVMVGDAGRAADRAGAAPVVVVLHAAADVVRRRHVVAHVVEEPDGQVGKERPGLRLIVGRRQSAVVADDDVVGVARVDPDRVDVVVDRLRDVGRNRLAPVKRLVQADAAEIHHFRVVRIDAHLAEVHRAWIGVVDLPPRRPAVVRAIQACRLRIQRLGGAAAAGLWRATGSAGAFLGGGAATGLGRDRALDQRVEDVGTLPIHVHGDAPEGTVGNPGLQSRPRLAAVGGFPEPAARTSAVHAARRPAPLVGGRVEHLAVGRIHHQIVRAGLVVDLQHLPPRLACVDRLVDAALASGPEERPGRRHEDDVVRARVDHDAVDVLRRAQADVRVRLAAVGGFVDAVAPRCALAVVRLARADPDEVRVALRDGEIADRDQPLILELGLERRAVVHRLPDAAVRRADVEDRGVRLVGGDVGDPTRHRGRADGSEVKCVERTARCRRGRRLPGSPDNGLARERQHDRDAEREDTVLAHSSACYSGSPGRSASKATCSAPFSVHTAKRSVLPPYSDTPAYSPLAVST